MTISAAGYIVHDGDLIHGTGITSADAWADANRTLAQASISLLAEDDDPDSQQGSWMRAAALRIQPATADLIESVVAYGGKCAWAERHGIACTRSEEALD